jgi:hypothetical protein
MIYLIGSLRNPEVPILANELRKQGYCVFDDWHSNGPEADDYWQKYEQARGRNYRDALRAAIPQNIFQIDKTHIDKAQTVVLVLPAGKSGHMEFGYAIGQGKKGYILLPGEPERYDVMYNFATKVFISQEELFEELRNDISRSSEEDNPLMRSRIYGLWPERS